MKIMKNIKSQFGAVTLALIVASVTFSACKDDIEVGKINENNYTVGNGLFAYINDDNGKYLFSNIEFRNEGNISLYLNT